MLPPSNKCCPEENPANQANLGKYSRLFELSHQILFQYGTPAQDRGGFVFNIASDVDPDRGRLAATESRAMCFLISKMCSALVSMPKILRDTQKDYRRKQRGAGGHLPICVRAPVQLTKTQ
jgi:hypothetical protein